MSPEEIKTLPALPVRAPDAHKGDFGHVLIVGGSAGMTGAVCMAAVGAQKGGAGLVTVGLPESLNLVAEVKLTSAMSWPLPEDHGQVLGARAAEAVLDAAPRFEVVAVGPGAGRAECTGDAMRLLVEKLPGFAVVDADGLNAVSDDADVLHHAEGARILTPHPGEMARLMGLSSAGAVQEDRVGAAGRFAGRYGVIMVLKGAATVVTDGERFYVNPTGNPGMACGGTGDVLTGLLAGLLCQGLEAFESAQLAAFVHGLAGDLAAEALGRLSMRAEDVLKRTAEAFRLVAAAGAGADAAELAELCLPG